MSTPPSPIDFRQNSRRVEAHMTTSVQKATAKFLGKRQELVEQIGEEKWQALRQAGHDLRLHTLEHLDSYLELLEQRVEEAGGQVHWAEDAEEARQIVIDIAHKHGVSRAVKVKSMATEEIHLNEALQEAGIQVRETDLGEYIVQMEGGTPSHIIVPAVHLTKEGIADLFTEKLGVAAPPEPTALTEIARERLREEFLSAEMGISGGNFLVAETGTLVLVTNEGNGRMCTTLPPLHAAVVGIDKVIPDLESLAVLLKLLPRSATGQKLTTYVTLLRGTRPGEPGRNGNEFHLVLLDNRRSQILAARQMRETMLCIRCGACLNICPVYNNVGGHAYGWVYSGPIGSMLGPQMLGSRAAGSLPYACSLCGACAEICPVKIPIPEILLQLRRRVVEGDAQEARVLPAYLAAAGEMGSAVLAAPGLYELGTQVLRSAQSPLRQGDWLPALPPPLDRWTLARPFTAFDATFRKWWRERDPQRRAAHQRQKKRRMALAVLVVGLAAVLYRISRRGGRR